MALVTSSEACTALVVDKVDLVRKEDMVDKVVTKCEVCTACLQASPRGTAGTRRCLRQRSWYQLKTI